MEDGEYYAVTLEKKSEKKRTKFVSSLKSKMRKIKDIIKDKKNEQIERVHNVPAAVTTTPTRSNSTPTEIEEIGPKLNNTRKGSIASPHHLQRIQKILPQRLRIQPWRLLYATREHGISLHTLYDKTKDQGPCIMIIKTVDDNIMGVFLSESIRAFSPRYYGGGESILFTFKGNKFKSFNWSKHNQYFILTSRDHIAVGGSIIDSDYVDRSWAIYLDNDFKYGSTYACETFGTTEPLHYANDFEIYAIEIWGF